MPVATCCRGSRTFRAPRRQCKDRSRQPESPVDPRLTFRFAPPRIVNEMADVVLSVLAHPDDAEFLCAGTLARLAREHGWSVHIASMNPGDRGSLGRRAQGIA